VHTCQQTRPQQVLQYIGSWANNATCIIRVLCAICRHDNDKSHTAARTAAGEDIASLAGTQPSAGWILGRCSEHQVPVAKGDHATWARCWSCVGYSQIAKDTSSLQFPTQMPFPSLRLKSNRNNRFREGAPRAIGPDAVRAGIWQPIDPVRVCAFHGLQCMCATRKQKTSTTQHYKVLDHTITE